MCCRLRTAHLGLALLFLLGFSVSVSAQNSIAGTVKDSSGGMLAGVTVEASSDVLIEKVRSVVTNAQGQYTIVDLRPGTYTVTYTLQGFNTVTRGGIQLAGSLTATLHVQMELGQLAESITVSGSSPLVDVQAVTNFRGISAEVVDTIPTGKTFQNFAAMLPGVISLNRNRPSGQDVGGSAGERNGIVVHGSRQGDMNQLIDGLPFTNLNTQGSGTQFNVNPAEVQEFTYELGANSAQQANGGVRMNVVPKEGGNSYKGYLFFNFANPRMQANNLTAELEAQGVRKANGIQRFLDINPAIGGPIKRDALWFFGSFRYNESNEYTGRYYDTDPSDFTFVPDLSRPNVDETWTSAPGVRLTWQANRLNKFTVYGAYRDGCTCPGNISQAIAPEAVQLGRLKGVTLVQAAWSSPITNRILLEAGVQRLRIGDGGHPVPGITEDIYSVTEQTTGFTFRAAPTYKLSIHRVNSARFGASYITGSHNFKVGTDMKWGRFILDTWSHQDFSARLNNGVPNQVTLRTTPWVETHDQNMGLGIYAQDRWTIDRLTATLGVRFDYHNSSVPEQDLAATRFVPARSFPEIKNVPNWKDLSPRVGAAYDLFGNGRTALRASLSRYVQNEGVQVATAENPLRTTVATATRTWTDANGDWQPQENELGPLSNAAFGQTRVTSRTDPDAATGWGRRGYNWEVTAGVQHELFPRVAVDATYYRRMFGNWVVTDNLAVSSSDYDPFCVTAPSDARLPGGGGYRICGLYDITTAAQARIPDTLRTRSTNYGEQSEYWQGFDLAFNARLPRGAMLSGSWSAGRTVFDNCDVVGKVDQTASNSGLIQNVWLVAGPTQLYCHQTVPTKSQIKLLGNIKLPWKIDAAATFQSLPGPAIRATWTVPNSLVEGLGRNLAAGANGATVVELVEPGTMYGPRIYQIDVRTSRTFDFGGTRLKGMVDLYNLMNSSTPLVMTNTYGPVWQQPSYIMPGRLIKLGFQMDF